MRTDRIAVVHTGYGYVTGVFPVVSWRITFGTFTFRFVAADEHPAHQETQRTLRGEVRQLTELGRLRARQPIKAVAVLIFIRWLGLAIYRMDGSRDNESLAAYECYCYEQETQPVRDAPSP